MPDPYRQVELMFTAFVLNIFERSHNPTQAMAWLKATCLLLNQDTDMMQRLVLSIMGKPLALQKITNELGMLMLDSNQDISGIIKLALVSRSQVYRNIKNFRTKGTPLKLSLTKDELVFAAQFLKAFAPIGGLLS